jgi:hypothetical protein
MDNIDIKDTENLEKTFNNIIQNTVKCFDESKKHTDNPKDAMLYCATSLLSRIQNDKESIQDIGKDALYSALKYLIVFILISVVIFYIGKICYKFWTVYKKENETIEDKFESINTLDDKQVTIEPNFIDENESNTIINWIKESDLIDDNPLNESFESSYGLAVKFRPNKNLESHLIKHNMDIFIPLLRRIVRPETQACIFNILIIKLKPSITESFKPKDKLNAISVGAHYDCTLGCKTGDKTLLPKIVDVIYALIPKDMVGGNLELYKYSESPEEFTDKTIVQPKHRMHVQFRGDSYHLVREAGKKGEISDTDYRTSLVIEQYCKIPPNKLSEIPDFDFC